MKYKNLKKIILSALVMAGVYMFLAPGHSFAFVTQTGGDGYIPFVYQGKIYNITHHISPSGNPSAPNYDLHCTLASGIACPTYPRYFSSTVGSTGDISLGTAGTADIYTSLLPNSTIVGSKLYYAAQRTNDNGIGCFDLDTALNCGYFQLGTLTLRTGLLGAIYPSKVDGVEQVGNQLFSIGDDVNMYCLDITNPNAPVACAGQPYAVNTGITSQMPTSSFGAESRLVHGTNIYFTMNYSVNTPAADAQVTCFDTLTDNRCAGWTSLDEANTSSSTTYSLFAYPDTSGNVNNFCSAVTSTDPVLCWNFTAQQPVSSPPGLFTNVVGKLPLQVRHVTQVGNSSYFALEGLSFTTQDGLAVCYNFTTQSRCSSFGVGGVKRWDGSDGQVAVNNGQTRDYGYAQFSSTCFVGLGDAGALWSFDSVTGRTLQDLNCADDVPPTGAPNTGYGSHLGSDSLLITLPAGSVLAVGLGMLLIYRARRSTRV